MAGSSTYISFGDLVDLFFRIKLRGHKELLSRLHLNDRSRTLSKWNTATTVSDFWIIPQIRHRWNQKCTGSANLEYEDYVVTKYLADNTGIKMLSVGCGTGTREFKFAKYPNFGLIEGIDMAPTLVSEAQKRASDSKSDNIRFIAGDFLKHEFEPASYDLILFNSSLHHFKYVDRLLQDNVLPLMKDGGYLVIFEYVGPNRLQWTDAQLALANALLTELPGKYKTRINSKSVKSRIYRPGLIRMMLADPSEAVDSESIIPSLHRHLTTIEEKKTGWDILHLLFKDIAHNFLSEDQETQALLNYLIDKEDEYLSGTGRSDSIFGVYRKQDQVVDLHIDLNT